MKIVIKKPVPRKFTKEQFVKNQYILRELQTDQNARLTDVHKRNEILKQNKLYNLDLERNRMHSALQTLPHNQQANLRRYIGNLENQMFAYTRKGRVP